MEKFYTLKRQNLLTFTANERYCQKACLYTLYTTYSCCSSPVKCCEYCWRFLKNAIEETRSHWAKAHASEQQLFPFSVCCSLTHDMAENIPRDMKTFTEKMWMLVDFRMLNRMHDFFIQRTMSLTEFVLKGFVQFRIFQIFLFKPVDPLYFNQICDEFFNCNKKMKKSPFCLSLITCIHMEIWMRIIEFLQQKSSKFKRSNLVDTKVYRLAWKNQLNFQHMFSSGRIKVTQKIFSSLDMIKRGPAAAASPLNSDSLERWDM